MLGVFDRWAVPDHVDAVSSEHRRGGAHTATELVTLTVAYAVRPNLEYSLARQRLTP